MQQYIGNISLIILLSVLTVFYFAFSEFVMILIWAPTLRELVSFSVIKKSNASGNNDK